MAQRDVTVGITATREGLTPAQLNTLIELLILWDATEVSHGDCVGGDHDAARVATGLGIDTVSHPPSNPALRANHPSTRVLPPDEYKARNRGIVRVTNILVALPKEWTEQPHGGTWYTVGHARTAGRAVVVIFPDGSIQEERNHDPRYRVAGR